MGNASSSDGVNGVIPAQAVEQSTPAVRSSQLPREKSFQRQKSIDLKSSSKLSREKSVRNILLSNSVDSDIGPLVTLKDGSCQTDEEPSFWLYADYWIFSLVFVFISYYYVFS